MSRVGHIGSIFLAIVTPSFKFYCMPARELPGFPTKTRVTREIPVDTRLQQTIGDCKFM